MAIRMGRPALDCPTPRTGARRPRASDRSENPRLCAKASSRLAMSIPAAAWPNVRWHACRRAPPAPAGRGHRVERLECVDIGGWIIEQVNAVASDAGLAARSEPHRSQLARSPPDNMGMPLKAARHRGISRIWLWYPNAESGGRCNLISRIEKGPRRPCVSGIEEPLKEHKTRRLTRLPKHKAHESSAATSRATPHL
jgi:hypothetical protein